MTGWSDQQGGNFKGLEAAFDNLKISWQFMKTAEISCQFMKYKQTVDSILLFFFAWNQDFKY